MNLLLAALVCLSDLAPVPLRADAAAGPRLPSQMEVEVTLFPPPEGKLFVQDLWRIQLVNTTSETFQVYLHMEIYEEERGFISEATSSDFTLYPGAMMVSKADIGPIDSKFYVPEYEDILLSAGTFPSGSYTILIQVFEVEGGLLGEGSFYQDVSNVSPPQLLLPLDESSVPEQSLVFSWLPPAPEYGGGWSYVVTMVEVLEGQGPEVAMESNPPWMQVEMIERTTLSYPLSSREPRPGRSYAWQVTAYEPGSGWGETSEVWSFEYEDVSASGNREGEELWNLTEGAAITAGPVLGPDLTAYFGSRDGRVCATNPQGSVGWRYETGSPVRAVSLAGMSTLLVSGDWGLSALDGSGALIWEVRTPDPIPGTACDGTLVFFVSEGGLVAALDPSDGTAVWRIDLQADINAPPSVSDALYVPVASRLIAIDPEDGAELWSMEFDEQLRFTPSVLANGVVLAACGETLYAIADGEVLWAFEAGGEIGTEPVQGPGKTALVATTGFDLCCVDASTGSLVRRIKMAAPVWAAPAAGLDGETYVGCTDGRLYCLTPAGELRWSFEAGSAVGTSPVVARDGSIVFGCDGGLLYKVGCSSTGLLPVPWPRGGGGNDGCRSPVEALGEAVR